MTVALVFPGQGSQSPGMAARYAGLPAVGGAVNAAVAEASEALSLNLTGIIADKEALSQTENTQPALLAVSVGVYRGLQAMHSDSPTVLTNGIFSATFFAGHSLGEYTALVCAGALNFADAVRLVRQRGLLMREAATGGMAAVIGDATAIDECCKEAQKNGGKIWAVNYNSPQQTVVAGDAESITACKDWTARDGIKRVMPLPVSIPSHCPLMQPAADALAAEIKNIEWQAPSPPVVHNATLTSVAGEGVTEQFEKVLTAQLTFPVRWTAMMEQWAKAGVACVYECGPGGVLSNLGKRMDNAPAHVSLGSAADIEAAIA